MGKAILFDLDGVLVDSRLVISSCLADALSAQGLRPPARESLERYIGPPLTEAFAELTGQPPDSELVLACLDAYRVRYREASLVQTTVFPGLPEILGVLGADHRLAVATSKPLPLAEPLLDELGLAEHFECVAAPALDAHHESKQMTIEAALARLRDRDAVMVGDRRFDIEGARGCGIPAIGVTWGIGSHEELADAGADAVIDRPAQLPQTVLELEGSP